jgi:hypothetical protein
MKFVAISSLRALAILGVAISSTSNAATLRGAVARDSGTEDGIFPPISNGKNQAPSSWASASASASSSSDEPSSSSGFGGENEETLPMPMSKSKDITPSHIMSSFVKDNPGDGYIWKVLKDDDKSKAPPAPTLAYVAGGGYGYGVEPAHDTVGTKTTYGAGRATAASASASADE